MTDTAATSMTIYNFGRSIAASQGRVHAVWHEDDGTTAQVFYARSADSGAAWQAHTRLSTTGKATAPMIAADGDTVLATWNQFDDATQNTVHVRRSLDGGASWQPEQTLTTTGGSAMGPVAVSGGRAYVVWVENEAAGGSEIYVRRSPDAGATWEPRVKISSSANSPSWVPTVTAAGDLVLIGWVDYGDANEEEYLRRSIDGGVTWEVSTRMTDEAADSWAPSIAVSGDDVYFTWFDRRDAGLTDVDVEKNLDDALVLVGGSPPASPPRDPTAYYLDSFTPRLQQKQQALLALAPTWVQNGGDPAQVQAYLDKFQADYKRWLLGWELYIKHSSDRGASWSGDTRLTDAPLLSARPSVVATGDEVHVAWFDGRDGTTSDAGSTLGGYTEIYYKASTDRGQTWGTDQRLTTATGDSAMATLAQDGDRLHVLWSDMRDGNWEVYYKTAALE